MKYHIVSILVFVSISVVSCKSIYCTKGENFVLKKSAKRYTDKILLPIECDRDDRSNSLENEEGFPSKASVCQTPLNIHQEIPNDMPKDLYPEYDPVITDDEGFPIFREPNISIDAPGVFASYRFLWIGWAGLFTRPPEAILLRLEFNDNGHFLVIKYQKKRKCRSGKNKVIVKMKEVSENDWNYFESILERNDFWNTPNPVPDFGHDANMWSLEGAKDGKYNIVDQANPSTWNNSVLLEAGEYLMRLAGFGNKVD